MYRPHRDLGLSFRDLQVLVPQLLSGLPEWYVAIRRKSFHQWRLTANGQGVMLTTKRLDYHVACPRAVQDKQGDLD